jgi:hypothetical protein
MVDWILNLCVCARERAREREREREREIERLVRRQTNYMIAYYFPIVTYAPHPEQGIYLHTCTCTIAPYLLKCSYVAHKNYLQYS